jgi:hypothetical protein
MDRRNFLKDLSKWMAALTAMAVGVDRAGLGDGATPEVPTNAKLLPGLPKSPTTKEGLAPEEFTVDGCAYPEVFGSDFTQWRLINELAHPDTLSGDHPKRVADDFSKIFAHVDKQKFLKGYEKECSHIDELRRLANEISGGTDRFMGVGGPEECLTGPDPGAKLFMPSAEAMENLQLYNREFVEYIEGAAREQGNTFNQQLQQYPRYPRTTASEVLATQAVLNDKMGKIQVDLAASYNKMLEDQMLKTVFPNLEFYDPPKAPIAMGDPIVT